MNVVTISSGASLARAEMISLLLMNIGITIVHQSAVVTSTRITIPRTSIRDYASGTPGSLMDVAQSQYQVEVTSVSPIANTSVTK